MSAATGRDGPRSPEELEVLMEDLLLLRDPEALSALFEERAFVIVGGQLPLRGRVEVTRYALTAWPESQGYVAQSVEPIQSGDTGIVVAEHGLHVMRRGNDGFWRYLLLYFFVG